MPSTLQLQHSQSLADVLKARRDRRIRELLFQARSIHEAWTTQLESTSDPELLQVVRSMVGHTRRLVNHLEAELHGHEAPADGGNTLTFTAAGGAR